MNPCCEHLFREAKREIEIRDKRIKELQDECTRLFEPTREFWNGTTLKNMNEKYEKEREKSKMLVEALEKISKIRRKDGNDNEYEGQEFWVAQEALKLYRGEI
jgi:uncharacterized protein YukE